MPTLKIFYTITDHVSPPPTDGSGSEQGNSDKYTKCLIDNYTCHGQILNTLSDPLYDLYCDTTNSKELWDALEKKYKKKMQETRSTP